MENIEEVAVSLKVLSDYISRYYEKKVIILLDEHDTPMQEAYMSGYQSRAGDIPRCESDH